MVLHLSEICKGYPGLNATAGTYLMENCIVCLSRHQHNCTGTIFTVSGDQSVAYDLVWENIYNDQMDRTYKDQFDATEQGAYCLAILLALKQNLYTVILKSPRLNGFDYYLGDEGDILFQNKARLEVSGIFKGPQNVDTRYKEKRQQIQISNSSNLPGIVGVIEFSSPLAKFGSK